jgi:large subunit ribosomal protein L10
MTREEKINMIKSIKSELDSNSNIYLTDCSGLNADSTSKLRRACFKSNIKMSVVKNTLLEKAMDEVEKDFGDLKSVLKGNTALMYSEVGNAPAKVIKNFRKKSEKPILKGAFIEESIYLGDDMLESLAEIKSKEELIGEIVTLLQSPAKNLISALKSSGSKISGVLKTLSEKNDDN